MDILCRLCGELISPHEVKCTIKDKNQNIEQKLLDCCRWALYQNDENLPENICNSCFECLEQSWRFCEKVTNTQNRFREFLVDAKLHKSENSNNIETNLTDECFEYHESTFHDFDATVWCDDGELLDDNIKDEPLNALDIDDETEMGERNIESIEESEELQPTFPIEMLDDELKVDSTTKSAENREHKNEISNDNEEENMPIDISFPECIEPHERNADGTVDPKAIARLKLCDWTIYQPQCHVCNVRGTNLYELRKHYKRQHPHVPMRYKCWLCAEDRSFSKRQVLIKHVVSHHCPYLGNWFVSNLFKSITIFFGDFDRLHKFLFF